MKKLAVRRHIEPAQQGLHGIVKQALQEKHSLLNAIIEGTSDAVFVKDRQGRYVMMNSAGADFLRKPVAEIIGKDDRDLFAPDTARELMARDRSIMESQETVTCEEVVTVGDETRMLLSTKGVYRDAEGKVAGLFGIARNITERKRAEEALRQREEQLRLIADSVPALISYVDVDHRYQFNNASYEEWFGASREWSKGRHVREVLGDSAYEAVRPRIEAALSGRQVKFENEVRRAGGEMRTVDVTYVPHFGPDGRAMGLYVIACDVTEHKLAEAEIRRLNDELERRVLERTAALRESEAQTVYILNTVVDGIITMDERGIIEWFNAAAEQMFGYTVDEVIGRNVMLMSSPYREKRDRSLARYRQTGIPRIIGTGREIAGLRKDGTTFPAELAVGGTYCCGRRLFVGIVRDVTERKRLEREILEISAFEQRRIGQDLHDGLGQFLTGVACLSKVLEQTLAAKGLPEAIKAAEIVTLVEQAIAQTSNLARGLYPVHLAAEGLVTALHELASHVGRLFDVSCHFQCEMPVRIHDNAVATHLYYIAREAVNNALRHGKAKQISMSLVRVNGRITLTVKDDGIGIPAVLQDHQGMGIHIMRYRTSMINGTLTIERDAGGGTIVACSFEQRR